MADSWPAGLINSRAIPVRLADESIFFILRTFAKRSNIEPLQPHRIAELLQPFLDDRDVPDLLLSSISIYLDMLLRWNERMNLTSVRAPDEIVCRHFGESLFAARKLIPDIQSNLSLIDVGSGAGFPGIPIKLWAKNIQLTLIESNNRKATFLREVIRALSLPDSEVFAGRAESFDASADVVTMRAVERFETVLPTALDLVKPGGRIALLISESRRAISVVPASKISWSEAVPVPNSDQRILLIGTTNHDLQEPQV